MSYGKLISGLVLKNPEFFDILLRFRLFPIALVSDIEKAFHIISVRPEDRDVLRF